MLHKHGGGHLLNAYDELNRLTAQTTTLGTVSYQYDTVGRRISMTASGQSPVSYAYDDASRLRTIIQAPLNPVTVDYDAGGRRTRLSLPNGVSTEYQYDTASRLTALIYRNALGPLGDLSYQYDANGNRTSVGGSLARTLLPDPVASATYDAANRQLTFGGQTLTHDQNGNLTSDGTNIYTWDARNRLVGITGPSLTASFTYDALGRRIAKEINGELTEYLYDGADIIQELTDQDAVTYLRSLNIDEPLARSGTEFYLGDALGSTLGLVDSAGTLQTQYTYEPFGQTAIGGPLSSNPFQYTGRENDAPTRLYHYRARYYHPGLHRFITEDPTGLGGGDANVYGYVGDNPLRYVDPLGLDKDVPRDRCRSGREDYWALNISIGPDAGAQFQLALDRYGRFFFGAGGQLGKSPTLVAGSLVFGQIFSSNVPSEQRLANFFEGGPTFGIGGGIGGGANLLWSPGNDFAWEAGTFSPQFGGGYQYAWRLFKIPMFARPC